MSGYGTSMFTDFNDGYTLPLFIAKKCAMVAVDKILTDLALIIPFEAFNFWQEVKIEIEKLK